MDQSRSSKRNDCRSSNLQREKPFKSAENKDSNGLSSGSGGDRQIYNKPTSWSEVPNYQEFRWNAMATTVVNELLHHSRDNNIFLDRDLDKAAKSLMNPDELAAADAQMKQKGYVPGTIGHRAVTANCKATNPYGPPPTR
jgi:hypothetical protein